MDLRIVHAALKRLEQTLAGMVNGQLVAEEEVTAARNEACRALINATEESLQAGATEAKAMHAALPRWAHQWLEPALLKALEAKANEAAETKPSPVVLEPFGLFNWMEDTGGYEAEQPLQSGNHSLTFTIDDPAPKELLARHAWLPRFEAVLANALAFAVEEALPLHNAGYRPPEQAPTSASEFLARLRAKTLTLDFDNAMFVFDDGDLFWGHDVAVTCDPQGLPDDVQIWG